MKSRLSNILLIMAFLAGLSLLLYPSISNYWNSFHATQAISSYSESVANMDDGERERMYMAAVEYNQDWGKKHSSALSDEQRKRYESILDVTGTGIMGYIEIPSIKVQLPIYHGTSEKVLQIAVGHLDWTSLPVGGESSHCVLSGHRGLPSAQLFTHLDRLAAGDVFMIRVLDEVMTYEVDQILIVLPEETENLQIVEGEDYCTLVTCTPYGINTHRLLVRGHRIENLFDASSVHVTSDAVQIESLLVAAFIAMPVLILLLIIVLSRQPKKKKRRNGDKAIPEAKSMDMMLTDRIKSESDIASKPENETGQEDNTKRVSGAEAKKKNVSKSKSAKPAAEKPESVPIHQKKPKHAARTSRAKNKESLPKHAK